MFLKRLFKGDWQVMGKIAGRSVLFASLGLFFFCSSQLYSTSNYSTGEKLGINNMGGPEVLSIVIDGEPLLGGSTVDFVLTFSKEVTGVDAGDFILITSLELENAAISKITGGGSVYKVTVQIPANADGTLRLILKDSGTNIKGPGLLPSSGFEEGEIFYAGNSFNLSSFTDGGGGLIDIDLGLPIKDMAFKSDGTKLFVLSSFRIYEYFLTIPYDLSFLRSGGLDESFEISNVEGSPASFTFSESGEELFVLTGFRIYRYKLSTAFDVSTAITSSRSSADNQMNYDWRGKSISLSPDGRLMHRLSRIGIGPSSFVQNNLGTPNSIGAVGHHNHYQMVNNFPYIRATSNFDHTFSPDGLRLFTLNGKALLETQLSVPYDLNTIASNEPHFLFDSLLNRSVIFNGGGTELFLGRGNKIYRYHADLGPKVLGIKLIENPEAHSKSVDFEISFSEPVFNVEENNFEPRFSNELTGASVTAVKGSGDTRIVTVSNIPDFSNGFLTLDLVTWDSNENMHRANIVNKYNTPLNVGFNSKEFHYAGAAFDISRASYAGVREGFNIEQEENVPRSMAFSHDGLSVFVIGKQYKKVIKYLLSAPYDVSTATYAGDDQQFSVESQESNPRSLAFNLDGTKMFVVGANNKKTLTYNLGSAYDLSTVTYGGDQIVFSVSAQENDPTSLAFDAEGTKMFVLGTGNDAVQAYALSAPFDVSTAVYIDEFSVAGQETNPYSLAFNLDGTKMYLTGTNSNKLHEYSLETPFDITVAVYAGDNESLSIVNEEITPRSIAFNADGSKLFVIGNTSDIIHQFNLDASPPELLGVNLLNNPDATAHEVEFEVVFSEHVTGVDVSDFEIVSSAEVVGSMLGEVSGTGAIYNVKVSNIPTGVDGTLALKLKTSALEIKNLEHQDLGEKRPLSSAHYVGAAFDISRAIYAGDSRSLSVGSKMVSPHGMAFNSDGTKLFIVGQNPNEIHEYHLTIPYEVSTAQFKTALSLSGIFAFPRTIWFNAQGTKMMVGGGKGSGKWQILNFDLTIAFDINTSSYSGIYSEVDDGLRALELDPTGSRLFHLHRETDTSTSFYTSDFSTPYELTNKATSIGNPFQSHDSLVNSISFNTDGTKVFVVGLSSNYANQYTLSEPYDLSSSQFDGKSETFLFEELGEDKPRDIIFSSDGTRMFVLNSSLKTISQYYLDSNPLKVTELSLLNSPLRNDTSVDFQVKFSTEVSGVDASDFVLKTSEELNEASIIAVSGSNDTYEVTVANIPDLADGYLYLEIPKADNVIVGPQNNALIEGYDKGEFFYAGAAFDLPRAELSNSVKDVSSQIESSGSLVFSNDGGYLYVVSEDQAIIFEYTLSIPFDVSSAMHFNKWRRVLDQETSPRSMALNNDGTRLFVLGTASDVIHEYDLTNPYRIASARLRKDVTAFSVSSVEEEPQSFVFSRDGNQLFVLGKGTNAVHSFQLKSPFESSTAQHTGSFNVTDHEANPYAVSFNPDGTQMFILGDDGDDITQYRLPVPYDITTAVHVASEFPVASEDDLPRSISFNNVGSKLYLLGNEKKTIFTYDLNTVRNEVTITSDVNNLTNSSFDIAITFAKSVSGFDVGDISVSNAILENFQATSASVYTVTVVPASDGVVEIDVAENVALDDAQNGNLASQTLSLEYDGSKPTFQSGGVSHFKENGTGAVYVILATDNRPLVYSLGMNRDGALFNLEGNVISFLEAPDFELPEDLNSDNDYKIEVIVSDGVNSVNKIVTITVSDLNETIPDLTRPVISSSNKAAVSENSTGTAYKVVATDENIMSYSLGSDYDEDLFNIFSDEVSFKTPPDFESPKGIFSDNTYYVEVRVTDGSNHVNKLVTISVTDLDDTPPVFASASTTNFEENESGVVYTAMATDVNPVTFELGSGNDEGFFNLDETSGALSFKVIPDFENPADEGTDNVYNIQVVANDGNNTAVLALAISVTNVDDTKPVFTSEDKINFKENESGPVYIAKATDVNAIMYSIGDARDENFFTIDQTTGVVSFKSVPDFELPLDANSDNVYLVEVKVNDGINSNALTVSIEVENVDDSPPVFTSVQAVNFAEGSEGVVYQALAQDANPLNYTLGSNKDEALFEILTGQVRFIQTPDFEMPLDSDNDNLYLIDVTVSDGLNVVAMEVGITVTDIDDFAPVFTSPSLVVFEENVTGTVYNATATDLNTVTYSLGDSNDEQWFNIIDGKVRFKSSSDFENPLDEDKNNEYIIDLIADDGLNSSRLTVTIRITDVDEVAPVITSEFEVDYVENQSITAYTVTATDDNSVTYGLGSGNDEFLFEISNNQVAFKSAPDYEAPMDSDTNNSYFIEVQVNDGMQTSIQIVRINVLNVDDTPPVFITPDKVNFHENTDSNVYIARATDENELVYELEMGEDNAHFEINSTTGVVQFKSPPDFEAPSDGDGDNVYAIGIIANDGTNKSTLKVDVSVLDIDEVAPRFISEKNVNVRENTLSSALTIQASDASAITYSLGTGNDEALFTLSGLGGNLATIAFNSPPDFENPLDRDKNNVYTITIVAVDAANNSNTQLFNVTVTDINENPVFTSSPIVTIDNNTIYNYPIRVVAHEGEALLEVTKKPTWLSLGVVSQVSSFGGSESPTPFGSPRGIASDLGNFRLYIIDKSGTSIRRTNLNGEESVFVGACDFGNNCQSDPFVFSNLQDLTVDGLGNIYAIDAAQHGVYKIASNGQLSNFAGFNQPGSIDGTSLVASFSALRGIVYDYKGNSLYVSDGNRIRKISMIGEVSTIAGSDVSGGQNGTGSQATFNVPLGLTTDSQGNVFIADSGNNLIRQITLSGQVSTYIGTGANEDKDGAGSTATLSQPLDLVMSPDGNLYISTGSNKLRRVSPDRTVTTVAGSGVQGSADGVGVEATFNHPIGLAFGPALNLYVSDQANGLVRKIENNKPLLTGDPSGIAGDFDVEIVGRDSKLRSTNQNFTIKVQDVEAPVFTSSPSVMFVENASKTAYTALTTDASLVTYSLGNGKDEHLFKLASNRIDFKSPPDFENPVDSDVNNTYRIDIKANDGLNITTQLVTITVINIDDTAPAFTSLTAVDFAENGTGMAYVATITDESNVTYSFGTENDERLFNLTADGQVSFKSAPDFEAPADGDTNNNYLILIKANDGIQENTQLVTITVTDLNEVVPDVVAPVFNSSLTASFVENATSTAYTINATDVNPISFSLGTDNDETLFNIVGSIVTFKTSPDFETPIDSNKDNSYVIEVKASDGNNTSVQIVTISVTNVDDTNPVFTSVTAVSFAENEVGTVYTISATDANAITYSLGTGNDEAFFNLNGGIVTFKSAPDFEVKSSYVIEVRANDGLNTANQTVTISITDVDEILPVFTSSDKVDFVENGTGTAYTVVATDANAVTYSLGTGNDEALFNIVEGIITFKNAPDFEAPTDSDTNNSYKVEVKANDGLNIALHSVTITVTDLDESTPDVISPVFTSTSKVSFIENGTGTAYTIVATDANVITYSLGTGNDEAFFNLNGGVVTFKAAPDFEVKSSYTIEVKASDGFNEATQTVTITITDVDEIKPVFASATGINFVENSTGTAYTISATDANVITYSLGTGNDEAFFNLNGGLVTFKSVPDFEVKSSYIINVIATDEEGNTSNQDVTITILDSDENAPIFTSPTATTFTENGTGTAYIIAVTDDSAITYSLGTGNDEPAFTLLAGVITFNTSPDFEAKSSYVINVIATDEAGNTSNQDVTITILDADEVAPIITSATSVNYTENGTGTAYTITATDDSAITYSLGTGNDEYAFTLSAGVITFNTSPDFEAKSSYVINVIATDEEGNTSNQDVTITILDSDENAPIFTSPTTTTFTENGTGTAYTIAVTDDSAITYSLGTGNDEYAFTLSAGVITFNSSPDFETKSSYVINVIATDEAGNTSNQDVTITILDADEVAPSVVVTSASNEFLFDQSFKVTITFNEGVESFQSSDLVIDNGNVTSFTGTENIYNALITAIADGEVQVSVPENVAQDATGNKNNGSNTLIRKVEAINVAPSAIGLSGNTIAENNRLPILIGILNATDIDERDVHSFTLVSGEGSTHNHLFNIVDNSLIAKTVFDYEVLQEASVRIRATDARGLALDVIKAIEILNVEEPRIDVFVPNAIDPTKNDIDLSFKAIRIGKTISRQLEISNTGNDGDLSISGITLPSGYSIDKSTATIASGVKEVFTISFSPTEEKVFSGEIVISSNAGQKKVLVGGKGLNNRAPVAVSTEREILITLADLINLRGYDPDGDAIEFVVTQQPENGTLAITSDGFYSFIPNALSPGQVYQDVLKFKVVETEGGLESNEATINFKFRAIDSSHSINALDVSSKTDEVMEFGVGFTDPILNDAYQLKVSYYNLSDPSNPEFVPLIDKIVLKSEISSADGAHSFTFNASSTNNGYLFNRSRVFVNIELTTANGYSASGGFVLKNEGTGSDNAIIEGSSSSDGEFFVFASKSTAPENEAIEVNMFAIELGGFSIAGSTIAITKSPLNGVSTSPIEVNKTDNLVQWKLTYTSETEVGLLDSLQFTVYNPERDLNANAFAKVEVIEVADAPQLTEISDQQTNEEESLMLELEASDPDSEISITATSSNPNDITLSLVNNSLLITPGLDFTGTTSISVLVTESNETDALSTFDEFQLTVNPINDKPVMMPIEDLSVNEDGQVVVSLSASDVDAELPLFTYIASSENTDDVNFTIEGNALTITPISNFNGVLTFNVTANDGEGTQNSISDSEFFNVTVNAVNDAPTSSATISTQTLLEAIPSYELDLSQYFTDLETEAKDLIYGVSDIANAELSINGSILTVRTLNGVTGVETADISASDGELSVTQQVTFVATATNAEVTVENPIADQELIEDFGFSSIDLTDVFALSGNSDVSFTYVISGNNAVNASVNGSFLELTSTQDFNGVEELIVIGTSDGKSSFTSFKITVSPSNDAPSLINALEDVSTTEDALLIYEVSSTVFDDVDGDALTYSATYDPSWLSFDASTRKFSGTPNNDDVGDFTVVLTVTDPDGQEADDSFQVVVSNTNDNPTAIITTNSRLDENIALNSVVTALTSVDPDVGDDIFSYALVSGSGDTDNDQFNIVGNELLSNSIIDFETKASYSIRIKTTDGFEGSLTQIVNLTVNDVNEIATDIIMPVTIVTENQGVGTAVSELTTTDPDASDSHSYSLVSGEGDADNADFTITNSRLTTVSSFDFETKSSYSVRIKTTDSGGLALEKVFRITVSDVNEVATDLALSANNIAENASISSGIADLTTTDQDANDSHSYSLVTGEGDTDNAFFKIEGTKLLAAASFDHETKSTYVIRLKTTDTDGLAYEKSFNIMVTDLNEAPTNISSDNLIIAENQEVGTSVGTLSTTDQDEGDAHSYSLVAGEGDTDNASFTIDEGVLESAISYNFESKDSYVIRIRTIDAEGLAFEKSLTVSIADEPEAEMRIANNGNLDPVEVGSTANFNLTVFNDGDGVMNVSNIVYPVGFSGITSITEIAPSASATLEISFTPLEAKTYSGDLILTYNGGQLGIELSAIGQIITSIDDGRIAEAAINMYPNPAVDRFTIDLAAFNGRPINITIINGSGLKVYSVGNVRKYEHTIQVSNYSQGIFIVMLQSGNQIIKKKLIIKR